MKVIRALEFENSIRFSVASNCCHKFDILLFKGVNLTGANKLNNLSKFEVADFENIKFWSNPNWGLEVQIWSLQMDRIVPIWKIVPNFRIRVSGFRSSETQFGTSGFWRMILIPKMQRCRAWYEKLVQSKRDAMRRAWSRAKWPGELSSCLRAYSWKWMFEKYSNSIRMKRPIPLGREIDPSEGANITGFSTPLQRCN